MDNLTKFLLTLSSVASNSSNHSVNAIANKTKSPPGKFKPEKNNVDNNNLTNKLTNPTASVRN